MADVGPVIWFEVFHFREGRFAEVFEIIVPNATNSKIIIVPEFAFVFGTIGGHSRIARMDRVRLAVFIEKVGETYFDENVVFFDVFLEFVFVFDNGVFEGDAVRAN